MIVQRLKKALNQPKKFDNWVPLTDEQVGQEYEWEYKNHVKPIHGNFWPTVDHFRDALRTAKVAEVTPEMDRQIRYRSRCSTKDDLKALTSQYRFPRDVDRIFHGLENNHPMPHPIVMRFPNGDMKVMSGNTRLDASFIHGVNPKALIVDVPDSAKPEP